MRDDIGIELVDEVTQFLRDGGIRTIVRSLIFRAHDTGSEKPQCCKYVIVAIQLLPEGINEHHVVVVSIGICGRIV